MNSIKISHNSHFTRESTFSFLGDILSPSIEYFKWMMSNHYLDWYLQAEADLRHARNARADRDYEWSCFAKNAPNEAAVGGELRAKIFLTADKRK